MKPPEYNESFSHKYIKPLIKAIKKYGMINNGDKVAVALSGGKDSISLLYLLNWLNKYSYLKFNLSAIHIETYRIGETEILRDLCSNLGVPIFIETIKQEKDIPVNSVCSICAHLKRGAMHNICLREDIVSLAFGHHATDAAETLLMNMLVNKKLGSFCPLVRVPDSATKIIRPMIYLTEQEIINLHKAKELPIATAPCPYEAKNIRAEFKRVIPQIEKTLSIESAAKNIVSALENIDTNNLYSLEMADKKNNK